MLLSDRDIKAQVAAGRLRLEPYEPSLLQPSSIDVRLDRWFRVFNNQQYTHIDPAQQQDDLTTLVEPKGDDPFVLHPGEFVLGSTLELGRSLAHSALRLRTGCDLRPHGLAIAGAVARFGIEARPGSADLASLRRVVAGGSERLVCASDAGHAA